MTSKDKDPNEPQMGLRDVAEAGMESRALGLMGDFLLASQRSIQATTDRLWENERRRRMALEVQISMFLDAADVAYQGTTREYEKAINVLRYPLPDDVLAGQHVEFKEN